MRDKNMYKVPQNAVYQDLEGNKVNIGTFRSMLQQREATKSLTPELKEILDKITDFENEQKNKEVI